MTTPMVAAPMMYIFLRMAFLFLFFTVALSLCVVGLIVLALAAILGSVRDDWRLKKPKREPRGSPTPPKEL
jgi:hypothetical protein